MAVASPPASRDSQPKGREGGFQFNWTAVLFMLPAALLLLIFVVFPAIFTVGLSFDRGRGGTFSEFVGLRNYINLFTNDPNFLRIGFPPSGALWNNVLWVIFYTFFCVFLGLLIAVMATRVRYEAIIKSIVFLPMAIAATAIGVIWSFVYFPNQNTGLLNALLGIFGIGPIAFLGSPDTVNWALIAVGVWGSVGFATVILSAALKGISTEVLEAARVDGASERSIFFKIIIPMVSLPISVVAVTLVVNVIKLFDLIYVMTRGGPGTSSRVIAFAMYQEAFPAGRYGYGAAIAIVMLLLLVPVLIFNVRRFSSERVTA
jgi:alpha-glucoside transport system permease protein